MLLDSNIIIYAPQPEHDAIRRLIAERSPAVSAISMVEVLGYHRLTSESRALFEEFFASAPLLAVTENVIHQAVKIRQARKMTLGDSLIAATALVHSLTLITHNSRDIVGIPDLVVLDPLANKTDPDSRGNQTSP